MKPKDATRWRSWAVLVAYFAITVLAGAAGGLQGGDVWGVLLIFGLSGLVALAAGLDDDKAMSQ